MNRLKVFAMESFESLECKKSNDYCSKFVLNSKPVVILKRLSDQQIKRYDKHFFEKYIDTQLEPNSKDITQTELMRHLGLISSTRLMTKPMEALKHSFPVNSIARIGVLSTYPSQPLLLDRNAIVGQNFKKVVKRVRKKYPLIENKSKHVSNEDIERQKQLEVKKELNKRLRLESNHKKKIISFVSEFEMTSQLFDRLVRTFAGSLTSTKTTKLSPKPTALPVYYNNKVLLKCKSNIKYNDWMPSDIERKSLKSELAFSLKGTTHKYTFSRRQRLEKMVRIDCGLSWKSRLHLSDCRQ